MKTKLDLKNLSALSAKNFKREVQKELLRLEKEGGSTDMIVISNYVFACKTEGAVLVPGELTGVSAQFWKEIKAERKSQRDFGLGTCTFEKGSSGAVCKINIAEGPVKPSALEKGLKKTKIKINALISKGDEVVQAVVAGEDEEDSSSKTTNTQAPSGAKVLIDGAEAFRKSLNAQMPALLDKMKNNALALADVATIQPLLQQAEKWLAQAQAIKDASLTEYLAFVQKQMGNLRTLQQRAQTPSSPAPKAITDSVGEKGKNNLNDVKIVQALLNRYGAKLTEDGDCGAKTIQAIKAFQKQKLGLTDPDGRIDPNGRTWKALLGQAPAPDPNKDKEKEKDKEPVKDNGTLPFTYGPNAVKLSAQAETTLAALLREAGELKALVTSTYRDPKNQIRVMYNNIVKMGVEKQKKLYGSKGDMVVDAYDKAKKAGKNEAEIKAAMLETMIRVGFTSKHNDQSNPAIDVSPGSLKDYKAFQERLKKDARVSRIIEFSDVEPAVHIELK